MSQRITYSNQVGAALDRALASTDCFGLFVIADANTAQLVLPRIDSEWLRQATPIVIPAGDEHKGLDTLTSVWQALSDSGATRHSVVVNVGGGMVTDLGGMAAATFKRGIRFINIPTTLLAAVDAAVGGKTGINFNGLKNEIGAFAPTCEVIISTCFLDTLPRQELRSGYAEMVKHAMLSGPQDFADVLSHEPSTDEPDHLLQLLETSVAVKQRIVEQDPTEQGLRRTLNLGHTVGHALESLALQQGHTVPHGYAVAWGLVTEAVLSHMLMQFPSSDLHRLGTYVREHYGTPGITCDDYPTLLELMRHDKKSRQGEVNCTLLRHIGAPVIDNTIVPDDMTTALDITRDYLD